jgi:hypothetical protein
MPLYRNKANVLLFVHIPKTGGSTIENTLKSKGITQALHSRLRLGQNGVTPQHMHRDVIEKWIPESFYDAAFCVVRNPYARISSEYKWQTQARNAKVSAFDTWVNNQFKRHKENEFIGDNHIRPQSDFVWNDLKVFHLEAGLEKPLKFAMRSLGLDPTSIDADLMRNDAKTKHMRLQITAQTLENIQTFYCKDFETLGYDPEKNIDRLFQFI